MFHASARRALAGPLGRSPRQFFPLARQAALGALVTPRITDEPQRSSLPLKAIGNTLAERISPR